MRSCSIQSHAPLFDSSRPYCPYGEEEDRADWADWADWADCGHEAVRNAVMSGQNPLDFLLFLLLGYWCTACLELKLAGSYCQGLLANSCRGCLFSRKLFLRSLRSWSRRPPRCSTRPGPREARRSRAIEICSSAIHLVNDVIRPASAHFFPFRDISWQRLGVIRS